MYEELDIPESRRELCQRGSTPRAETNGSARAGSQHHCGQSNGKPEADLVVLGCHLVDFWINIALCQSLIVEAAEDDGPPIYQVCNTMPGPFMICFHCIGSECMGCLCSAHIAQVRVSVHAPCCWGGQGITCPDTLMAVAWCRVRHQMRWRWWKEGGSWALSL